MLERRWPLGGTTSAFSKTAPQSLQDAPNSLDQRPGPNRGASERFRCRTGDQGHGTTPSPSLLERRWPRGGTTSASSKCPQSLQDAPNSLDQHPGSTREIPVSHWGTKGLVPPPPPPFHRRDCLGVVPPPPSRKNTRVPEGGPGLASPGPREHGSWPISTTPTDSWWQPTPHTPGGVVAKEQVVTCFRRLVRPQAGLEIATGYYRGGTEETSFVDSRSRSLSQFIGTIDK